MMSEFLSFVLRFWWKMTEGSVSFPARQIPTFELVVTNIFDSELIDLLTTLTVVAIICVAQGHSLSIN